MVEHADDGGQRSCVEADCTPYLTSVEDVNHSAQNITDSQKSARDEPSAYMSLKDNREPGNYYETLSSPGRSADREQTKKGEHTIESKTKIKRLKPNSVMIQGE